MARRPHVMTSKRRVALRKAQLASARKRRRGGGAVSSSGGRRRRFVTKRGLVRAAGAAGAIGVAVGAAYTFKNRERLIIAPLAVKQRVFFAKHLEGVRGAELKALAAREKIEHAHRSTYRAREYQKAIKAYKLYSKGRRLGAIRGVSFQDFAGDYVHTTYARSRHTRATHRLRKIKGQKVKGFSHESGRVRAVFGNRVRVLPF